MSDLDWLFTEEALAPVHAPARRASTQWPACGARTRKGRPCVAPGSGVGGRCPSHGGVPTGGPFVLLAGLGPESRGWNLDGELDPRRWTARLLPAKMWRAVTLSGARDFDSNLRLHFEAARGPERKDLYERLQHWPCVIGLRVARRLVERGRVTHAVVDCPRTARKLRTLRPPDWDEARWTAWVDEHAIYGVSS